MYMCAQNYCWSYDSASYVHVSTETVQNSNTAVSYLDYLDK